MPGPYSWSAGRGGSEWVDASVRYAAGGYRCRILFAVKGDDWEEGEKRCFPSGRELHGLERKIREGF